MSIALEQYILIYRNSAFRQEQYFLKEQHITFYLNPKAKIVASSIISFISHR